MPATTVEAGDVVVVNCSHRCNVYVTDDSPRLPLGEPLFLLRAPLESGLAHGLCRLALDIFDFGPPRRDRRVELLAISLSEVSFDVLEVPLVVAQEQRQVSARGHLPQLGQE